MEVPGLTLADTAAAAAFALTKSADWMEADVGDDDGDLEEEEETTQSFEWEEEVYTLPEDLQRLWKKYGSGDVKFDLKSLLAATPRFSVLPVTPPDNNYDSKGKTDRLLKDLQQRYFHVV